MKENELVIIHRLFGLDDMDLLKEFLEEKATEGLVLVRKEENNFYFHQGVATDLQYYVGVIGEEGIRQGSVVRTRKEYMEYYSAVGWNFLCVENPLLIAYATTGNYEEMRYDEQEKFSIINKEVRKTAVCYLINMIAFLILAMSTRFELLTHNQQDYNLIYIKLFANIGMCLCLGKQIIQYYIWYYRSKRKIELGEKLSYRNSKIDLSKNKMSLVFVLYIFFCIGFVLAATVEYILYLKGR